MFLALLELRLPYMRGRSARIEAACRVMGTGLKLAEDEMYALSLAARFHDLGMLAIPDTLLLKPGKLTREQRAKVAEHADLGGRLVAKAFPDFPDAIEGIWYHHERPDGRGPLGLRGSEIPITAAVVALLAAVESMANDRPHRKPLTRQDIIEEIRAHTDTQFNRNVVDVFLQFSDKVYASVVSDRIGRNTGRTANLLTATGYSAPLKEPGEVNPPSAAPPEESADDTHNDRRQETAHSVKHAPATEKNGEAVHTSTAQTSGIKMGDKSPTLGDLSPAVTKDELLRAVKKALDLRPLGPTVSNVMAATQDPSCSVEDVAKEVSTDQALSVRLLKLANSSAYWRGKRINSVKAAVGRIGIETIRKLIMSLDILGQYEGTTGRHLDVRLFWEHCIGCGLIASTLGKLCEPQTCDEYFVWGIIHDVGRLIMVDQLREHYEQVWQTADTLEVPLEVVEVRIMTLDHCEILKYALQHWRFPSEFTIPVVNHHRSVREIEHLGRDHMTRAACVALADRIAHGLLLGSSGNDTIYPLDDLADLLQVNDRVLEEITAGIPDEVDALKIALLSRTGTEPWPEFASHVGKGLSAEVRPLCADAHPGQNAYRMFCRRISNQSGPGPPNLGVIYLDDVSRQKTLFAQYEKQEDELSADRLPVLVICNKGRIGPDDPWLRSRRNVVLNAPVSITKLVNAINQLLG